MDIRVTGRGVDTGTAFRTLVEERLGGIARKYFSRALSAQVVLGPGPHDAGFTCDIVMHVMQGLVLKGHNRGQEANPTFEGAAERIEKQLRRYMRRLKDKQGAGLASVAAPPEALDNAGYTVFAAEPEADEPGDAPLTIAETRVDIPDASVSDAVMMLDLRNTTALMFRNSRTGAFNMVYRREDGNIGWVEPR
ncbi:ribosome hibernation-promoting factor, HPF/YfiA family [Sandaracinobacteroides saxicola]|uniref:Ribosome hibernation promoting factor n=1 Tax=Sandaracinobacteroides saxicola TaxID=2759707 RepID=A0A7G5IM60_9SPHN|nr:ribosome-associated translation inhibitor RaiA [Sandaracinobacteroides saxicola]QMW24452.1 ribosome-associated translation inhibitor RaiA [Sandaracinobacteroides saxicola]